MRVPSCVIICLLFAVGVAHGRTPQFCLRMGLRSFVSSFTCPNIELYPSISRKRQHEAGVERWGVCVTRMSIKKKDRNFGNDQKNRKTGRNQILAASFNLIKVLLGSGVLALPGGVAAFSDHRSALLPAVTLIVLLGLLSAYTFGLYGRLVHSSQSASLGELWGKKRGKESAWIISLSSLAFCFGGALAYTILLGDTFTALASTFGRTGFAVKRQFWILFLAITTLLPLSNLESLLALAPLSIVGVFSVIITAGFLGWRCPFLNTASPYSSMGGPLLTTLGPKQLPLFGTYDNGIISPACMILVGMAATAYLGHFSAPTFYNLLLKNEEMSTNDAPVDLINSTVLRDYFVVTAAGFSICTLINCLVMAFGFLTFGGNCEGVILNNFSTADAGASICRFLMAVCVTGGYPFLLTACRSEILELWSRKSQTKPLRKQEKIVTNILVSILTAIALVTHNAGFVIGFTGAIAGSWVGYSFPALLFLTHTGTQQNMSRMTKLERCFCRLLIAFGAIASVIGGTVSFIDNFFPHMMK